MVGTSTARLQLYKPNPADNVDVNQDLNANADKIDLLGKKPEPVTNPFIKRNTSDGVTSGTDTMFETLTVLLKANHWYETWFHGSANTTLAAGTPNGAFSIRLKAGGSVAVADPAIANCGFFNVSTTSPFVTFGSPFDVPTDGTYTLGLSANSGGAGNTLNINSSGGADNTGNRRCLWVKDLGEK